MAVGFGVKGIGALDGEELDTHVGAAFDLVTSPGDSIIAPIAFSAADLALGPLKLVDLDLDDLSRKVMYGDIEMTSLGIIPWDTAQAWTEVFALLDSPGGKQRIYGAVGGGLPSKRFVRVSAVTYNGVDSVGAPVKVSGNSSAMTISATAAAADRLVGVFGTRSGIASFSGAQQRYLDNTGIGLGICDAPGTGTAQNLTATRQKAGQWGGILVPLYAADTVASCPPIMALNNAFGPVVAHREPRTGGLKRQTFKVELEQEGKYVAIAEPIGPNDVTPISLDWSGWLDLAKDRIKDGFVDTGDLEKGDDWFSFTDQTALVGPGGTPGENVEIVFTIKTWGNESYTRTVKLPIRNL